MCVIEELPELEEKVKKKVKSKHNRYGSTRYNLLLLHCKDIQGEHVCDILIVRTYPVLYYTHC